MRFIYLSILIFFSLSEINAQTIYGLNDCIGIGLERNFSIRIARNTESIAKNNYTKGNAGYLPSVDFTSRYGGSLNNNTQNLVDGGQSVTKGINNTTTSASLSMGWTIFDGFSVQTTYKKLAELEQLGALNTQMEAENLIANIISGYYNYILQVQMLKNMEYAMALSKERLRIDEERYLLGSSSKMQVLQSRVYLNADSSRLSKQFEEVRSAQIGLNELMAMEDLGAAFDSKDVTIDVIPQFEYENIFEQTLSKNTSLLIASKNKSISEYDYKLIESRSYPYLSLSSSYNYNFNTYSNSTNKNQITNGMNYGLTLGVNLYDGFNQRRNLKNSTIELENKELKYFQIEQGVKADLITIYNAYDNNLRIINLEEQNVQTATENLDIALESYKLGSLSGLELREVQKSLLDAKERLLLIHYQAKLAEISLQLISGNIMAYYE
jgi:outer membrane protein TolC